MVLLGPQNNMQIYQRWTVYSEYFSTLLFIFIKHWRIDTRCGIHHCRTIIFSSVSLQGCKYFKKCQITNRQGESFCNIQRMSVTKHFIRMRMSVCGFIFTSIKTESTFYIPEWHHIDFIIRPHNNIVSIVP